MSVMSQNVTVDPYAAHCRRQLEAPHERTFCQTVAMMTAASIQERELQRKRTPRIRAAGTSGGRRRRWALSPEVT